MERISRDEMLMEIADAVSRRSTCPRAQVGVVIARESRVLSTGYVGSPSGQAHCTESGCEIGANGGCLRTVHGESNAIAFAAREGIATRGCDLYTTLSPCNECAKLIINAGISRVVYHSPYRDGLGIATLLSSGVSVEKYSSGN